MKMKRRTLFTISPHQTDIAILKESLNESQRLLFDNIVAAIRLQLGQFKVVSPVYPYRVTNINYLKYPFIGEKVQDDGEVHSTECHLLIILSGILELPSLSPTDPISVFSVHLTDATDAYWFVELLKYELARSEQDGE